MATASSRPNKTSYDADAIQTLEGLEAVRKRPGMYIGGTGSRWAHPPRVGAHRQRRRRGRRRVRQPHRGHVAPRQVGRGDPTTAVASPSTRHAKRKVSALEVVLTELHAGGKFGGGAYGASGGLHGVGASVVNALSTQARRRGRPRRARPSSSRSTTASPATSTTTAVQGRPRAAQDQEDRAEEDRHPRPLLARLPTSSSPRRRSTSSTSAIACRTMCFLVPGLKVVLVDKRAARQQRTRGVRVTRWARRLRRLPVDRRERHRGHHAHRLGTFEEKVPVDGKMSHVERELPGRGRAPLGQGLRHHDRLVRQHHPDREGGTHVAGFERALDHVVNDVLLVRHPQAGEVLAKKGEDRAEKDDVQEGPRRGRSRSPFPEPQFRGQTKQELGTPAVQIDRVRRRQAGSDRLDHSGDGRKTHVNAHPRQDHAGGRQPRHLASRRSRPSARHRASALPACPTSWPTAAPTAPTASSSSSRATRPRARPRPAATASTWRSFRCGARWSTPARRP